MGIRPCKSENEQNVFIQFGQWTVWDNLGGVERGVGLSGNRLELMGMTVGDHWCTTTISK